METAVVLAGGDPVDPALIGPLPDDPYVVAADSGLHHAQLLGLPVHAVVGDMDSVDETVLADAERAGVPIERFPADKDATDLELALRHVTERGINQILVVGGHGADRLDHFLANALLLTSAELAGIHVTWLLPHAKVTAVTDRVELSGAPGDIVSLLPVGGAAGNVTTSGLRWTLSGERLDLGTTRGVSNEFVGHRATVTVGSGTLLVVHERSAGTEGT